MKLNYSGEAKMKIAQKVRKTAVFLSKTAVLMVAEGGLEPPTSGL